MYVFAVEFVTALGWKWLVVDKIPFEFDKKEGNCLVFRPGYQYSLVKSLAKFGQKKRWKMRMMRLFFKKKVLLKGEILTVSKLWRLIGLLHVVRDRVFSYQHSALFLGDNFRLTIFRNISKLHVTNRYKGNSYCLLLESVFCGRMCHFINWTVYPSRNQNKNSKNQAWMWPNKMWYSPKNLTFL